jgi:hypothetical protein
LIARQHRAPQCDQLGDAHAGGVQHLDQRVEAQRAHAVAPARRLDTLARGLDQAIDLGHRQRLGESAGLLGRQHAIGRVLRHHALAGEELEELADGREPPGA